MSITKYVSSQGMLNQQAKLDVHANNIANVNTFGFKGSNVSFQTIVDAKKEFEAVSDKFVVGDYGAGIAKTSLNHTTGTLVQTGGPYDYAVTGDSYFGVRDSSGNLSFTRNGQFRLDESSELVTMTGQKVEVTEEGLTLYRLNTDDLVPIGNQLFELREGATYETSIQFPERFPKPINGALEQSNVDLGQELTELMLSQRAYSMNSKVFEVEDEISDLVNNLNR